MEICQVSLLGMGNSVFKLGDKMKNIKSIAGVALLAMMATSSHAAKSVTIGELQGFTGPLESMIGAMSGGANFAVTEANAR